MLFIVVAVLAVVDGLRFNVRKVASTLTSSQKRKNIAIVALASLVGSLSPDPSLFVSLNSHVPILQASADSTGKMSTKLTARRR